MKARVLVLSSWLFLLLPQVAAAGPKEEAEAYKTLGKSAFQAKNFDECAAHFRKSYSLQADANTLFNVALCHEKAEDIESALQAYKAYLDAAPDGDRAPEVKTRIELLELKLQARKSAAPVEQPVTQPVTQPVEQQATKAIGQPLAQPETNEAYLKQEMARREQEMALQRASAVESTLAQYPKSTWKPPSSLDNLYMALDLGALWLGAEDGDGAALSLDFRGNFGFASGVGFIIGIPGSFGSVSVGDDSCLFGTMGFDFGVLFGSRAFGFFATPGMGLIGFTPTNENSGPGLDLRATTGVTVAIFESMELRAIYKRHFLDGIDVLGLSVGFRFLPH